MIKRLIYLALDEDFRLIGDVTTLRLDLGDLRAEAAILAKEELVVSGIELTETVLNCTDIKNYTVNYLVKDGELVNKGTKLAEIQASFADLLKIERTLLNLLQRMSGVATNARRISKLAAPMTVLDTRKTIPGFRILDKYSVKVGGASNHRFSLSDRILVKNNHVDSFSGGMRECLEKLYQSERSKDLEVEVEVRDFSELKIAVEFKPDWIMLDNFSDIQIKEALVLTDQHAPNIKIEVSGGLTVSRFPILKELGVKYLSMGALTHSVSAVDISLSIQPITKSKS